LRHGLDGLWWFERDLVNLARGDLGLDVSDRRTVLRYRAVGDQLCQSRARERRFLWHQRRQCLIKALAGDVPDLDVQEGLPDVR